MKNNATYLIAKYIPDLRRMEPRNIGIILWSSNKSYCRFLTSREAAGIVRDVGVYSRWTDFWKRQVDEGVVRLPREQPVYVDSLEYLHALKKTQRENYVLDDGGDVVTQVKVSKGQDATDFLFQQLVETTHKHVEREETLAASASTLLKRAGLINRGDFQGAREIECSFNGISEPLKFHYYFGNGSPQTVLHRAKVASSQSVNSTAWMFDRLSAAHPTTKRGVIINTSDAEFDDRATQAFLSVLNKLAVTIDLANEQTALNTVVGLF
jgi:hypothetical protein